MSDIEERLEELRDHGLSRKLRLVSGPQGPRVLLDGKPVLLLCSTTTWALPTTRVCARQRPTPRCAGAWAPAPRGWSAAT